MLKKLVAISAVLFLVTAIAAPVYAQSTRTLQGQVMKSNDEALPGAIVYLKNTKTLSVRSFTSDDKGNYRFPSLSPNIDYEIYAVHQGAKSDTKTLSAFDSRPVATINLRVNTKNQ
jgi:Carboxypeptidase regulatory-like domain